MSINAVHIRTSGFQCPACPDVIRKALKGLPGVRDVVAVESMEITSVLFDPDQVRPEQLRERLEKVGFTTEAPGLDSNHLIDLERNHGV